MQRILLGMFLSIRKTILIVIKKADILMEILALVVNCLNISTLIM